MEGDAGSSRLNPTQDDEAERSEAPEVDEAERSEAEEADSSGPEADSSGPEADEADGGAAGVAAASLRSAQRSRLFSRGWAVGACATLVVLAALVGVGGYFALRSNQESKERAAAEAVAVQAAKDCVTATQAPDLASITTSQQKIIDCATGDFGAQASLYSGVLVDAYQAANAQVQVSDIRAAAERHNDDGSIEVLVAFRVKVTNSTVQGQESGYRLRVQMAPDSGTYKIAKLDLVTK